MQFFPVRLRIETVLAGTFWCIHSGGITEGIAGAVHQRVLAEHGHLALRLPTEFGDLCSCCFVEILLL